MKAKKIIINLVVFFSYFFYEIILVYAAKSYKIDYFKMDTSHKIIFLTVINIIYIIFLLAIYKFEIRKDIDDFKVNRVKYFKKYIVYYLAGVFLMGITNIIIQQLTNTTISGNEETVREYIKLYPLYMTFSTVIYAPLVEELIFRKSIKNIVSNKYVFIILSGVIFGALHISDFSNTNQILLGIPYIIMGLDFAYIYYKTNNIFTTMTFHILHNSILLCIQLIGGLLWKKKKKNIIILEQHFSY